MVTAISFILYILVLFCLEFKRKIPKQEGRNTAVAKRRGMEKRNKNSHALGVEAKGEQS